MDRRLLAFPLLALTMLALAWLLIRPPSSGPPLDASASGSDGEAANELATHGVGPRANRSEPTSASAAAEDVDEVLGEDEVDAAALAKPRAEGEPPLTEAEARIQKVDAAVVNLLTVVAPELDITAIDRRCAKDGRRCTFEGPWPGDDFFARWVRAIGKGEVAHEDLEGVTFRTFEPIEKDGEKLFHIVAVAPDAPTR